MRFEYYNFKEIDEETKKEIEEKSNLEKGFHLSEDKTYQIPVVKDEYYHRGCLYEYDEDKIKKNIKKKLKKLKRRKKK